MGKGIIFIAAILLVLFAICTLSVEPYPVDAHETESDVFHHEHIVGYHNHIHDSDHDGVSCTAHEDNTVICSGYRGHGPNCNHSWRGLDRDIHEHPCKDTIIEDEPAPISPPPEGPVPTPTPGREAGFGDWHCHYHNGDSCGIYHRHAGGH